MIEKRFRTNDLVKFDYSEIGEYVDENHTDRPLRNDEVCDLLNEQQLKIRLLEKENEDLQEVNKENQLLHEENVKQCEKWKNLYELSSADEEMLTELKEENQELKRLIKRMGELGGFNKHLIKTICGD